VKEEPLPLRSIKLAGAVEIPNEQTIQAIEDGLNNRNLNAFENAKAALDYLGL
jgi:hypothetical protein